VEDPQDELPEDRSAAKTAMALATVMRRCFMAMAAFAAGARESVAAAFPEDPPLRGARVGHPKRQICGSVVRNVRAAEEKRDPSSLRSSG
jgi:hypothetical protein